MRDRVPTWEMLDPPPNSSLRTATLSSAIFNLSSTIVGGGVLSLPFAISVQGIWGGLIGLVLSAAASDFSIYILIASSRSRGARGYEDVAAAALGEPARILTVLLIFTLTYLVTVAYIVLCGDLLSALVDIFSGGRVVQADSRTYVILGFVAAVSPLCFFRRMDALRFTSILSVVSVFVLGVVTAWKLANNGTLHPPRVPAVGGEEVEGSAHGYPPVGEYIWWPRSFADAVYAAPIESVAFLCHFNVLPMQDELIRPTRERVQRVTHTTMGICLFLYVAIAMTGYLRFTSSTCGDYLNNFPNDDVVVTVGRIGLLLTLYCSFPLLVLPCRGTLSRLISIMFFARKKSDDSSLEESFGPTTINEDEEDDGPLDPRTLLQHDDYPPVSPGLEAEGGLVDESMMHIAPDDVPVDEPKKDSTVRHVLLTVFILSTTLVLALKVNGVVTIWSIAGSTVAMMIAYVLPATFYIRLRAKRPWNRRLVGAWMLLICAIILIGLTSWQAVAQLKRPNCPKVAQTGANVGSGIHTSYGEL